MIVHKFCRQSSALRYCLEIRALACKLNNKLCDSLRFLLFIRSLFCRWPLSREVEINHLCILLAFYLIVWRKDNLLQIKLEAFHSVALRIRKFTHKFLGHLPFLSSSKFKGFFSSLLLKPSIHLFWQLRYPWITNRT